MNKMLIELDREKVEREQIYDIVELESYIDSIFAEEKIYKNEDGVFVGGNFVSLGAIVLGLYHAEWFMENVKTWLWYELERETDTPTEDDYSVEDLLTQFRAMDKKQMLD